MTIRPATLKDLEPVSDIYQQICKLEAAGMIRTGWQQNIYPTAETARAAFDADELFVYEENGVILASAILNRRQPEAYAQGIWRYPADDAQVMVLHTLAVSPALFHQGIGKAFVQFFERYAKENGSAVLRIDTNVINQTARALYAALGYREAGEVPCLFNGIPGVTLVLLEKKM